MVLWCYLVGSVASAASRGCPLCRSDLVAALRRRSARAIVVACTELFFSVPANAVAAEGLDILHLFHSNPLGQGAGEALEQRHDRKGTS